MQRMAEVQTNVGKEHVVERFPPDALNFFLLFAPLLLL